MLLLPALLLLALVLLALLMMAKKAIEEVPVLLVLAPMAVAAGSPSSTSVGQARPMAAEVD